MDDCKIKAEVISINEPEMSMELKVKEVLKVGFGFQSSLYKDQEISVSYSKAIETDVKSLAPKDDFVGTVTSELSLGEKVNLILTSLNK